MSKILNTKLMTLEEALSNYKDTKGVKVTFTVNPQDPNIYTGTGTEGFTYYIDVQRVKYCEVKIVG